MSSGVSRAPKIVKGKNYIHVYFFSLKLLLVQDGKVVLAKYVYIFCY